jgi:predicted nucleic acid-binding protein
MKPAVFIDTSYILALVNTADNYHKRARAAALQITPPFVTTEAVLTEIGNALSRQPWRSLGIATLRNLRNAADIQIVPVDATLFDCAVSFYSSRLDKEWGLTDCISFVVMQERDLIQVLTTDHHFEQAGFQIVM